MGYPIDFDEKPTTWLLIELDRRKTCKSQGICSYCGRVLNSEPSCKMAKMHTGEDAKDLNGI